MAKKRAIRTFGLVALACLAGCRFSKAGRDFALGEHAYETKQFAEAMDDFDRVIKREKGRALALKAAAKNAKIAFYNRNNYRKALSYYRYIVLYSPSDKTRFEAQKKIADIYFENMADYQQAILEFSNLLEISTDPEDIYYFRKSVAKSYFFLSKFFQAKTEIALMEKMKLTKVRRRIDEGEHLSGHQKIG